MKDVYVLMLTTNGQIFNKQKGIELGADSYMTKPFDPDKLVEVVSKVLGVEL